ncbi:MAG: serine hydrolase [Candidatus Eisenbacteria bacterium]
MIRPIARRGWAPLAFVVLFLGFPWPVSGQAPAAAPPGPTPAEREIARIAGTVPGDVGVAALHLEKGTWLTHRGDERFPMASAYKVPIAAALLARAARGEVDLDSMVVVGAHDVRPGSGIFGDWIEAPGAALSLRNLLRLSLLISDNTATDLVLRAAGGPEAVTARVRELGIRDLRIDRSTLQLVLASDGAEGLVADDAYTREAYEAAVARIPEGRRSAAAYRAFLDVRDTSTPRAMAELLREIWTGEAVAGEEREFLLRTMRESANLMRLAGLLPPGVEGPAHKTGTIWGGGLQTVNDVGIVELPDGRGHVALAIFITRSESEVDDLEKAIAHLARTVVDAYIFSSSP